jgi:hypothetical protein
LWNIKYKKEHFYIIYLYLSFRMGSSAFTAPLAVSVQLVVAVTVKSRRMVLPPSMWVFDSAAVGVIVHPYSLPALLKEKYLN